MSKLSDLRVSASKMLAHRHSGMLVHPATILALIAVAEVAKLYRNNHGDEGHDLDAALKALEAT